MPVVAMLDCLSQLGAEALDLQVGFQGTVTPSVTEFLN